MNWVKNFLSLALVAGWALALPALAEGPWEVMPTPDTRGGLVLAPRLETGGGRLQMAWSGTNEASKITEPEFMFSSFDGSVWTRPKAPYFGDELGRVRRLALASARQAVGALFQRTTEQSGNAFEVLYAVSTDGGWSYSRPSVADSFVHEGKTGTAVAMAGIGGRRPTFALAWLTEASQVRAGVLDPLNNSDRPRASTLGNYGPRSERVELAGEDGGGFVAAWNDGSTLRAVRLKPIIGDPEEAQSVATGTVETNFALTDWRGRRPLLVFETAQAPRSGGPRRQVHRWADGRWQKVDAAPPASGEPPFPQTLEAAQDEDGGLHVVSLPRTGDRLLYSRLVGGRWSEPETVALLDPNLGVTGFDVAVLGDRVYAAVAQGPRLEAASRKVRD